MVEPKLTLAQVIALIGGAGTHPVAGAVDGAADLLHSGWYDTEEVAALIGVDPSTLRRWRTMEPLQGPPFVRLTSRVTMYSVPDVQAWLRSRRIDPSKAA